MKLEIKELDLKKFTLEDEIGKSIEEFAEFLEVINYAQYLNKNNIGVMPKKLKEDILEESADVIQVIISVLQKLNLSAELPEYIKEKHNIKMLNRPREDKNHGK